MPAWSETPAGVQPSSSAPPTTRILSLDELRRLAIEGINASSYPSRSENFQIPPSGHGEYRSMPLDGRVDLMRPKMEKQEIEQHHVNVEDEKVPRIFQTLSGDDPSLTPLTGQFNLRPGDDASLTPLAGQFNLPPSTPGLYEVPPSPRPPTIPLPPITPIHQLVATHHFRTSEPQSPSISEHALYRSPEKTQEYSRPPHRLTHPQKRPHSYADKHGTPPRPRSPTMLIWNPAVDPPPTSLPLASAFPSDTYFPNLWDTSTSKRSDQTHPPKSLLPDSAALFEPPLPPEIPESLVQQGHYRNVTGEDGWGAIPSPDRTKVKHVFPWEEKPRHLPGRVFPAVDSPKPSLFLSPESQTSPSEGVVVKHVFPWEEIPRHPPGRVFPAVDSLFLSPESQTSSSEVPTTPEAKSSHLLPALSPLPGFPVDFNYTNAWDTIPSIQKYAERLAQPPTPKTLAPAFENKSGDKRRRNSWEERAEVSSRDGDVEDEGDDTADERVLDDSPGDDGGTDPAASGRRRSKHASPIQRKTPEKKQYREIGVQTDIRQMQTQGVQTEPPLGEKSPGPGPTKGRRPTMSGKRWWSPSSRHDVPPLVTTQDIDIAPKRPQSAGAASPDTSARGEKQPLYSSPLRSPIAALPASPGGRHSTTLAAPKSTPLRPPHLIPSPPPISSQTSNSSSLNSPISPIGPQSPSENSPRPRKPGRVWDPARGVELFKRGSEEVLARFLRMGSREDEHR